MVESRCVPRETPKVIEACLHLEPPGGTMRIVRFFLVPVTIALAACGGGMTPADGGSDASSAVDANHSDAFVPSTDSGTHGDGGTVTDAASNADAGASSSTLAEA